MYRVDAVWTPNNQCDEYIRDCKVYFHVTYVLETLATCSIDVGFCGMFPTFFGSWGQPLLFRPAGRISAKCSGFWITCFIAPTSTADGDWSVFRTYSLNNDNNGQEETCFPDGGVEESCVLLRTRNGSRRYCSASHCSFRVRAR